MSGQPPTAAPWGLAFLGAQILLSPLAWAAAPGWPQLLAAFEQRGFQVSVSGSPRSGESSGSSHPRCAEPNLYGLYLRSRQLIVICPRGNRAQTLMHEGWHAIQHRCLQGAPLLSDEQLQRGLGRGERREIELLYRGSSWQREAEARVMARQPTDLYFGWVDRVCARPRERTPVPAPAPGASGVPLGPGLSDSRPAPAGERFTGRAGMAL